MKNKNKLFPVPRWTSIDLEWEDWDDEWSYIWERKNMLRPKSRLRLMFSFALRIKRISYIYAKHPKNCTCPYHIDKLFSTEEHDLFTP